MVNSRQLRLPSSLAMNCRFHILNGSLLLMKLCTVYESSFMFSISRLFIHVLINIRIIMKAYKSKKNYNIDKLKRNAVFCMFAFAVSCAADARDRSKLLYNKECRYLVVFF